MSKRKFLIDVDTGIDDSIALLYILNQPEIEVVGITTSCGNVDAYQAAENTLRIIKLSKCAYEVPVIIGANQPLEGEWGGTVAFIHGHNGVGDVDLPVSQQKAVTNISAEDYIYQMACKYEGELEVITLGRMTNLAQAILKYPDLIKKIKKVVAMGGTLKVSGNVSPVGEANFAGDPKSCDIVFMSGLDVLVVGLDVTMKVRLKLSKVMEVAPYVSDKYKEAFAYMVDALKYYMTGNRIQDYCIDECPLHDPLTMMVAVNPSLVSVEYKKARMECEGTYCKGMVVTDMRVHPFDANYIGFAMDVDSEKALNELFSVFWK
ncbi:MAG: nucleoside hydrolase [Erysipelotrichaceae bacterium]